MNLIDKISAKIRKEGDIPFVDFMHQALYAPNLGYYSSGLQKFGAGGDFITAPELTPLFGHALANQCQQVLNGLDEPILFEFGAGSGRLCVDVLTHLERLHCLPREYHILEVSGHLKRRQQELLQLELPHLVNKVKWLSQWPSESFVGVVILNEVLDAMPVHRFLRTKEGLLESYITLNKEAVLREVFKPCTNPRLITYVKTALAHDLYPYQSEANLFIEDWINRCSAMLKMGAMFIIDYGFPRHEYYHPDRHSGTLMCHYQHLAHTNPLAHIGEQDITAHVDFTQVAEAADAAGFHVAGFSNQAAFLMGNGLLDLLSAIEQEPARTNAQQAVKKLVQPNEMGELFKVIALTKHIDEPLAGFQLLDKRVSL